MSLTLNEGDLLSIRVAYRALALTDRAFNVLHYRISAITGAPANLTEGLSEIGEEFYDEWATAWAGAASQGVAMQGVTVTSVFPLPRSVSITYNPIALAEGTVVSDPLPLQDAPTILKKTDRGERWAMGRIFVVGTPESHQAAGVLNATGITALEPLTNLLFADITVTGTSFTATLEPVLITPPEDNPVRITPITAAQLSNDVLKRMDRRRPGKGS